MAMGASKTRKDIDRSVNAMCDDIELPNGQMISTIRPDDACLCNSTDEEIVLWIYKWARDNAGFSMLKAPVALCITRHVFGWTVEIKEADGDGVL